MGGHLKRLLLFWACLVASACAAQEQHLEGFVGQQWLTDEMAAAPADGHSVFLRIMQQAELGSAESQYLAGLLALYGADGVRQDAARAYAFFALAAAQGNANAQTNAGIMCLRGIGTAQDSAAGAAWLERALARGSDEAEWRLGRLYYEGAIGAKPTGRAAFDKALPLFESSAAKGSPNGQFYLGLMHEYGLGVRQQYKRAAELYALAAEQEHMEASYYAGIMSLYGRGVRQDMGKAARLVRAAALGGVAPAMHTLGKLFTHGQGVEQDYRMALVWFDKAATHANANANANTNANTNSSAEAALALEARAARDELQGLLDASDAQMLQQVKQHYDML